MANSEIQAIMASVQLIETCGEIAMCAVDHLSRVRNAPNMIQKRIVEVEHFVEIAELIKHNPSLQTLLVANILRRAFVDADRLLKILIEIHAQSTAKRTSLVRRASKKVSNENRILAICNMLQETKALLILSVASINSDYLCKVNLELVTACQTVDGIFKEYPAIRDTGRKVTIVIDGLSVTPVQVSSLHNNLPVIFGKITTVDDDMPFPAKKVTLISNELLVLSNALERLALNQQVSLEPVVTQSWQNQYILPFSRDQNFVGREEIIDNIDLILSDDRTVRRLALVGLGGIGKSQIAIEYAYRLHEKSPDTLVFWVNASTATRIEQSYRNIATIARLPGADDPGTNILPMVLRWLENGTDRPWLMILDSADDTDVFFSRTLNDMSHTANELQSTYPVSVYLPETGGSMLITSRNTNLALRLTGNPKFILKVDILQNSDALQLLQNEIPADHSREADRVALIDALSGLPLAITQAAAFITMHDMSISEYLGVFRRAEAEQIALLSIDGGDSRRDSELPNALMKTWLISFDQINRQNTSSVVILGWMSLFDAQAIPRFLLNQNDNDFEFDQAIDILIKYSFIRSQNDGYSFSIHRLVQLSIKNWLELSGEMDQRKEEVLKLLSQTLPTGEYENWKICKILEPHVRSVLGYSYQSQSSILKRADIVQKNAWFLLTQGDYKLAEAMALEAVKTREDLLGLEKVETLDSMDLLATAYGIQGRWSAAEQLNIQVLKARKVILGDEHSSTISSMANLGSTFSIQGRWKEAEELLRLAVTLSMKVLGETHPDTLSNINNLTLTLCSQGRWKEAEQFGIQVLKVREKILGDEHPSTLVSLTNLALIYKNQGRWDTAEELEKMTMKSNMKVLGKEHPATLNSINNLASTYRYRRQWEGEEMLSLQLLQTISKVLGREDPHTLKSMDNLAYAYQGQKRWSEAEELGKELIKASVRVYGQEHPFTLRNMASLSSTYQGLQQWKEAEELEEKLMTLRRRVLGENHPDTLFVMSHLSTLYLHTGRLEDSRILALEAAAAYDRILGTDHPDTLRCNINVSDTWIALGALEKAEEVLLNTLNLQQKIFPASHPDILRSVDKMIHVLRYRPNLLPGNQPPEDGRYIAILSFAAVFGHEKLFELLYEKRMKGEIKGDIHENLLTRTAKAGHESMVRRLLEKGADVNFQRGQYGSALYAASAAGHEAVIRLLLQNGADVNAQCDQNQSALYAASTAGHNAVVKLLLENGADVNALCGQNGNALYVASAAGHNAVMKLLLENGADINALDQNENALYAASTAGHNAVVKLLLENGADVNALCGQNGNALYVASAAGHNAVVKLLLENGADINALDQNENALYAASAAGHNAVVRLLLENGADINAFGQNENALYAASAAGHNAVVRLLLENGADVNAFGQNGNALYAASAAGHNAVVKLLLENGAYVNAVCGQYGSALCAASAVGHEALVKLLLESGADVNAECGQNRSALSAASAAGHEAVVRLLLMSGAVYLEDIEISAALSKLDCQSSASTGNSRRVSLASGQTSTGAAISEDVYTLLTSEVLLHPKLKEPSKRILAAEGSSVLYQKLNHAIGDFCRDLTAENPDKVQRRAIQLLNRQRRYFALRVTSSLDTNVIRYGIEDVTLGNTNPDIHETIPDYLQSLARDLPTLHLISEAETNQEVEGDTSDHVQKDRILSGIATNTDDSMGNTEDTIDGISGEDEFGFKVGESLPFLSNATIAWLRESNAFCNFICDLTMEVSSPMKYIDEFLSSRLSASAQNCLTIHVEWNLEEYVKCQLDNSQQILTALTISGDAIDAEAATCHEYCVQNWPDDGSSVLEALQHALISTRYSCNLPSGSSISFQMQSKVKNPSKNPTVVLTGTRKYLIKLTQQISWLSTAFRSFEERGVALSRFKIYQTTSNALRLKVLKLEQVGEKSRSCWHPLFQGGVIAWGFPFRGRNGQSGIELPLGVMIELADIVGPVFYEGGIVLKGFSSIIFPVSRSDLSAEHGDNSIQWHSIHTLNDSPANLSLLKNFENRWLCQPTEMDKLIHTRTFLGCYKKVIVHLATKEVAYNIIEQSALRPSKPMAELTGLNFGAGFNKIVALNSAAVFTIPKNIRVQRKSDSYDQMLTFSSKMPVILYDTFDQRAWMVPALSVIYHMVHVWFSRHKDDFTTGINRPPYARAISNIGGEARDIISRSGGFHLYNSVEDEKPRLLSEHIKDYLLQFEQLMAVPPVHNSIGADKLTGWDLMDIISGEPLSTLSAPVGAKFQGNWYSLIQNSNMIVLFCKRLGDIIVPESEEQTVCAAWKAVPPGRDYLTATVHCLQKCSAYFPDSNMFSKLIHRRRPTAGESNAIFADCSHENEAQCHRAQDLWSRDEASSTFPDLKLEGAVVFGKRR